MQKNMLESKDKKQRRTLPHGLSGEKEEKDEEYKKKAEFGRMYPGNGGMLEQLRECCFPDE